METAETDMGVTMQQQKYCRTQLEVIKSKRNQVDKLTSDMQSIIKQRKSIQKKIHQVKAQLRQTKVDNLVLMREIYILVSEVDAAKANQYLQYY